jgi:hypothetical protein
VPSADPPNLASCPARAEAGPPSPTRPRTSYGPRRAPVPKAIRRPPHCGPAPDAWVARSPPPCCARSPLQGGTHVTYSPVRRGRRGTWSDQAQTGSPIGCA